MHLREEIKSKILSNNKDIRLDKFIEEALFSKNGYYNNKKPIGRRNDFTTAPEISQMFGEIIGLYLLYFWKTKINSKFNLVELGPGKGTLFNDIINSVSNYPLFIKQAKIKFIEINKILINIQKKNSKKFNLNNIEWFKDFKYNTNEPSIVYCNEFFDCFPVRQFIFKQNWLEKYIGFNKDINKFIIKDKVVRNKNLLSLLETYKKEKIIEISFERNRYFEKICKLIRAKRGVFLIVDYGYLKNIKNFTLQAIQNHKFSNVLEDVGEKDISSHVNFGDFIKIAKKNNLKIEEFCTQKEFLMKFGILERYKKLSKINNKNPIKIELDRLIHEEKMGKIFKFLVVTNL